MKTPMMEILEDAAEHAEFLVRMGIDEMFAMLFFKDYRESYVPLETRRELVNTILSYTNDDDWSRFPHIDKTRELVNSVREKLGLAKRDWKS